MSNPKSSDVSVVSDGSEVSDGSVGPDDPVDSEIMVGSPESPEIIVDSPEASDGTRARTQNLLAPPAQPTRGGP